MGLQKLDESGINVRVRPETEPPNFVISTPSVEHINNPNADELMLTYSLTNTLTTLRSLNDELKLLRSLNA